MYVYAQAGCSPERVLYYENKEGGHGGAADSKQQAYMTVSPAALHTAVCSCDLCLMYLMAYMCC